MTTVLESELPDFSEISLDALRKIDNPILLDSIQRLIEKEDGGTNEIVAGFQSAI